MRHESQDKSELADFSIGDHAQLPSFVNFGFKISESFTSGCGSRSLVQEIVRKQGRNAPINRVLPAK